MDQQREDPATAPTAITVSQIEGPFYRPDAPYRTDLRGADMAGEPLIIAGTVRSSLDMRPLSGAVLDVWQSDHSGDYDTDLFRGKIVTDTLGQYRLTTILPANYLLGPDTPQRRARHIHFKVQAAGYTPLTTQCYFADDPYLDLDPFADPTLVVKLNRPESHETAQMHHLTPFSECTFDITLARLDRPIEAEYDTLSTQGSDDPNLQLLAAARDGDVAAAAKALAASASTTIRDSDGSTALILACQGGHMPVVELLLGSGADPAAHERTQGMSALMLAAISGEARIVERLLAAGSSAKDRDTAGLPVLSYAVYGGNTEVVRCLLDHGADATQLTDNGCTTLMIVSPRSTTEMVALLVDGGAQINAQNRMGGSALMIAAAAGNPAFVRALLDHGAAPNMTSRTGWTALMWAAQAGSREVVNILLEHGAERAMVNRAGQTASDLAAAVQHQPIVDLSG